MERRISRTTHDCLLSCDTPALIDYLYNLEPYEAFFANLGTLHNSRDCGISSPVQAIMNTRFENTNGAFRVMKGQNDACAYVGIRAYLCCCTARHREVSLNRFKKRFSRLVLHCLSHN